MHNNEHRSSKKWIIQTIICLAVFSFLYICSTYSLSFSLPVNNFRTYALAHNTDFKWIFNNTVSTMSSLTNMMFEDESVSVFNSTALPSPTPSAPPSPAAGE